MMTPWTTDNLAGKRVTVVGLGKSGLVTARFCQAAGADVTVSEAGQAENFGEAIDHLEPAGVTLEFGPHQMPTFEESDLIVLSPGVPHTIAPFEAARKRNIPVMGEMELAARFITDPIVAVTGTNGKTTTTELLGAMLTASGYRVFVGGNIGTPLLEYVEAGHRKDWLVVEVSSFQLDTMAHFRPRIGCLLNISEDHLDRYPDYAAYATSKWHLFSNQTADDTAIINGLIPDTETIVAALAGRPLFFNSAPDGWPRAARIQEKALRLDMGNGTGSVDVDLSSMHLVGRHNEENVAAAALATLVAGGSSDAIQAALNSFRGLPHRVSFVKDVNGVRYYDDSKATNVDAVARALDSFDDPVVLIMGGRDKGGSYGGLTERIRQNVSQLIVMGEAAGIISEAFGPVVPIRTAADMATAVRIAAQVARAGQVVLLSPACASFDMYDSYHQRGEDFCRQVQKLV